MISLFKIRVFNPKCFVPPFSPPRCNLPIFSFLPSRTPYSGTQIISRGSRSTIVQSPYHSRGVRCTIGNTQKWNTSKIHRIFNFTRKTRISRHFWQKNLLWINCKISPQIQSQSSYFVKKIHPDYGNFTAMVTFCICSWKFYPSQRIFYTTATCAT